MKKQEAKELTLEVWRYLAEHPEIDSKANLPPQLFSKINMLLYKCPLCHVLRDCYTDCPLNKPSPCFCGDSLYWGWLNADTPRKRKNAAQKIVKAVQAWRPE